MMYCANFLSGCGARALSQAVGIRGDVTLDSIGADWGKGGRQKLMHSRSTVYSYSGPAVREDDSL